MFAHICIILAYVKEEHPGVKVVYIVGQGGSEEELSMVGLRCVKANNRSASSMTKDEFGRLP